MGYTVLNRDDLPRDGSTFEFEGLLHQGVGVSFIWVDMPPGGSVRLHKHPYMEIFIIQEGVSAFTVGTETLEGHPGEIILVPAETLHKFRNMGTSRLKQVDIHLNDHFVTDWLE